MAWGVPPPGGGGKRGRDTKVSLPLLTPLPFLWTRRPSVARLKTRGPQGRLVPQGTTLDRSEAFRSDGVRALHRMAAHCYARQIAQADLRALQRPKSEPTPGTEPPFPPFRRATEGSVAAQRRVWGSQEGEREPYGALFPFCPCRWAPTIPCRGHGIPRRRRRPLCTLASSVKLPPPASRCIGGRSAVC